MADLSEIQRLVSIGDYAAAAAKCAPLADAHPPDAPAQNLYAFILFVTGKARESLAYAKAAAENQPDDPVLLANLARVHEHLDEPEGVLAALDRASQLQPDWDAPYFMALATCESVGWFIRGAAWARRARRYMAKDLDVMWKAANILFLCGYVPEANELIREISRWHPTDPRPPIAACFCSNYLPGQTPQQVFDTHRRFGELVSRYHSAPTPSFPPRKASARLRVGIVSPDLSGHSVGYFIEPFFRHYNREKIELFGYYTSITPDAATKRMSELADHWATCDRTLPEPLATRLRQDRLDIILELTGHTDRGCLMSLQLRPAPVQVTYIGYPNTTGLPAINFRIVDSYTDPVPSADALAVEKLFRLDPCFLCYQAPPDDTEPGPPPCLEKGFVTFGSFNSLLKVNDEAIAAWTALLAKVPNSRLLIKAQGLEVPALGDDLTARFEKAGLDPARLELLGRVESPQAHRRLYDRIDIALDTFPYNGTTTTCEAMWMGVPVVTFAGQMHAGRVGLSLLSNVGYPELVAKDVDGFIHTAAQLAADTPRLTHIRSEIRGRMRASPLCDGPGFTRRLENALHAMAARA